jgi:single-strand DNA-binding protein
MKAQVFVSGKLGQDATVKEFDNQRAVIEFSVASNSFYRDKNGEKIQDTQWHTCKKFTKEVNQKFVDLLKKGASVLVSGSLMYNQWEETAGKKTIKHKDAYIQVDEIDIQ